MVQPAEYYNTIARGYNLLHGEEQRVKLDAASQKLLALFPALVSGNGKKKLTVLDVGCGTGISSDYWAQKFGCEVVGVDPAAQLIAQNNNKFSKFVVGSAEKLPFADKSFDVVVSFTAIQNFSDVEMGLKEIVRVGKSWFVLTTLTGTPDLDKIRKTLHSICDVKEEFAARNDTVFIAHRR